MGHVSHPIPVYVLRATYEAEHNAADFSDTLLDTPMDTHCDRPFIRSGFSCLTPVDPGVRDGLDCESGRHCRVKEVDSGLMFETGPQLGDP